MNIFDIIGPIMVGPSSSHTAGAVRIGYVARKLLGEPPSRASVGLSGSFAATGEGHGTDRAIIAGLLGMHPDDNRIPDSFQWAEKAGLDYQIYKCRLQNVHPNSVILNISSASGHTLEIVASSVGGGRIRVCRMDGLDAVFSAEQPTLIVHNADKPGSVAAVAGILASHGFNIGTFQVNRGQRGGYAVMVVECDEWIPPSVVEEISRCPGILKTTCLNVSGEEDAPAASSPERNGSL